MTHKQIEFLTKIVAGPSPGGRAAWESAPQHASYAGQTMPNQGYAPMPPSAGGYGRGQQPPNAGWNQAQPPQGYGNGYQGYQG